MAMRAGRTGRPTWVRSPAPPGARFAALGACLAIAAILGLAWLDREGFSNQYYSAAVRSMLTDPRNFFFIAYDPGGFVSVDKPPLGLWIQAASAALLGYTGTSLLLPQVMAQIASVALLYALVARTHGAGAGLIAALVLALMPISVATSRNNTVDGLLVPVLLAAAWAALRATETGRLRWLIASMAVVGIAFNIKMLQAYLVLPAIIAVYLLGTRLTWRHWLWQGLAALVVLIAISLSWAVTVDLTPSDARPYVGGSRGNSALELVVGYNGISRLQGLDAATVRFGRQLVSQVGWLLPLGLIGLGVSATRERMKRPLGRKQQGIVLWGTWLLGQAVVFSVARFWHPYYLVVLAPAIAALVGIGLVALWAQFAEPHARGWLLPLAIAVTGVTQLFLLAPFESWLPRLAPAILFTTIAIPTILMVARRAGRWKVGAWATAVGLAGLLIAPTVWASIPVVTAPGDPLPLAGPRGSATVAHGAGPWFGPTGPPDPGLLRYLLTHRGDVRFLLATMSSATASPYIIATGLPVMAIGGFDGVDEILSIDEVADLIASGEVRYFMIPDGGSPVSGRPHGAAAQTLPNDKITSWIRSTCRVVAADEWRGTDSNMEGGSALTEPTLYDCAPTPIDAS